MPECTFRRYVEEMPRVRALLVLDLAEANLYAQLTPAAMTRWWSRWTQRAEPTVRIDTSDLPPLPFTVNGVPVNVRGLRMKMGALLGSQFQAN